MIYIKICKKKNDKNLVTDRQSDLYRRKHATKSNRVLFGQRPQQETKSCRMGRNFVHLSVGPFVHPSIRHPSKGSGSQLEGSDSQFVGSEGLPEGSEGLPEGSEGLLEGQRPARRT